MMRLPAVLGFVLLLVLGWSAGAIAEAPRFTQSTARARCFEAVEIAVTLDTPAPGNPFVDAVLAGDFTRPAGDTVNVDGFCDDPGGRVFRIRFMPTQPGRHTYSLGFASGGRVARHTGEFTALRGRHPGPVRVDPGHPFHFVREGTGRHWFWNATTTYMLLGWDDPTIAASVNRLADLGVNRIRVALCGRPKDGSRWNEPLLVVRGGNFAFKMEPWVAASPDLIEKPDYDVSRFNLELFRKTERLLRLARERDVVVSMIFYVDGRDAGVDPFGKVRMGGEDERRYYRYVAARFASFPNVMWDLANEYRLFRDDAWAEKMGAFLRERDPYDHLMSIHGHGDFRFRLSPWADFALFQSWDEHGGYEYMLRNRREQQLAGRPMPQINEEYGYEDHYPFPWGEARLWPARTADTRRRLAWEITMAGCYQTTGERADTGTGAGRDTGGGWINGRGDSSMTLLLGYRHLRRFFEGLEWWKLQPSPDLLLLPPGPKPAARASQPTAAPPLPVLYPQPLCLADPGRCYVLYLPRGGAATVDLAPGDYRGRWFNPRDGRFGRKPVPVIGGRWTSPAAPDAEDWVLLVQARR